MLDPTTIVHQATIAWWVIFFGGLAALGVRYLPGVWRSWRKSRR
jgi:hypothetical protein